MKRVGFSSVDVESSVVGIPMMLMELDIARKRIDIVPYEMF
ncbi:hypothetical protein [Desulfosarcina ovata]|nr:hypothetical protein [Desulfosarcina ovata]